VTSPPVGPGHDLLRALVGFASSLRREGLPVGSGDVLDYSAAAAVLGPGDLTDLYWAGRIALIGRPDDIGTYDRVFRRYFLAEPDDPGPPAAPPASRAAAAAAMLVVPAVDPGERAPDEQARLGWQASDAEILTSKAFAGCTGEELAALRRIMARIRLAPPPRQTRRTRPARRGHRPDPRATVRRSLRLHGEPPLPRYRRRRTRPRPLVLILDVSGSMADYSRALLQFAHCAHRAAATRVEVFCFGTRLTHLTPALRTRSPDVALARAAVPVGDLGGGTRIGAAVNEFIRRWGRRGMARGAVVLICSDGMDRGAPELLDAALRRLTRLCHRTVWVGPHAVGGTPSSVGMLVAAPYLDLVVSGHDLAGLERLAVELPTLSRRVPR
jgi:uncharacterized protein